VRPEDVSIALAQGIAIRYALGGVSHRNASNVRGKHADRTLRNTRRDVASQSRDAARRVSASLDDGDTPKPPANPGRFTWVDSERDGKPQSCPTRCEPEAGLVIPTRYEPGGV
jgi:hypothetical protein